MKQLLALLMLALLPSVVLAMFDDPTPIKIGEHRLCVPKQYTSHESGLFDWIYQTPGLDKEMPGFLFDISTEEVLAVIPRYKVSHSLGHLTIPQNISGLAQYLSDEDRQSGRQNTGLNDMWRKQGAYKYRHVERDEETGLFKVFATSESESRKLWNLFSRYPNEIQPVPDLFSFSVASCQTGVEVGDQQGPALCDLDFIGLPHIEIKASISGDNLHLYNKVQTFIRGKLHEWKDECY